MSMNIVSPRFTPTTQVKANNSQRSGNGLNAVEQTALKAMSDLRTIIATHRRSLEISSTLGGDTTEIETFIQGKQVILDALKKNYGHLVTHLAPVAEDLSIQTVAQAQYRHLNRQSPVWRELRPKFGDSSLMIPLPESSVKLIVPEGEALTRLLKAMEAKLPIKPTE